MAPRTNPPAPSLSKTERGIAARTILDSALFQQTLGALENEYVAAWRTAKTVEAREDCHRYVVLIEKLKADLTSIATTGDLERRRLDELEGKERKIFAWPKT